MVPGKTGPGTICPAEVSVGAMGLGTYKDLCIDAVDADLIGRFWAGVLVLDFHVSHNGARLDGPTPAHTVWINAVPESKHAKLRVHLDVHGGSVEELTALGAAVIDDTGFDWTVMADPEGNELCLFLREAPPAFRLYEICVDSVDCAHAAVWWREVVGGTLAVDDGWTSLTEVPNLPCESIVFVEVPEQKQGKNRVHIDLTAPSIEPILDHGATLLRPKGGDLRWHLLADPGGNEFCVFTSDEA